MRCKESLDELEQRDGLKKEGRKKASRRKLSNVGAWEMDLAIELAGERCLCLRRRDRVTSIGVIINTIVKPMVAMRRAETRDTDVQMLGWAMIHAISVILPAISEAISLYSPYIGIGDEAADAGNLVS